jgi:hypothetical protein
MKSQHSDERVTSELDSRITTGSGGNAGLVDHGCWCCLDNHDPVEVEVDGWMEPPTKFLMR